MSCENRRVHGHLDVSAFLLSGAAAIGLKIRRLVTLKNWRVWCSVKIDY
jgi:hypothetical protein